ncbi:MAG: hypothetical protein CVU11_00760 [Bacteroidetes bacterium HGW-Bacteroidetes-6]|jgi:FkbM family methyltransferase|nr:MAG: hypothetical protein CVU11_00760 [Bacteroidetes bacterium HGW-Bacteroidetes-6]
MKVKTQILNFFRRFLREVLGCRILRAISNGKRPNSFIGKFIPPHYLFKKATIKIIAIDNLQYRLDISKVVDHFVYFGFSDRGIENFLQRLKPDFIVFDVGANIGVTTLPFSKKASKVFAFEPSSANFIRLKEHVELNQIENIELVNKGLGNKETTLLLETIDDSNPGMNRIRKTNTPKNNCEKVEIVTIDKFVSDYNIEKVDAIKIDIEGFEMKAILGAKQTLQKFRPIMLIELDNENLKEQGDSAIELIKMLLETGYKNMIYADSGEALSELSNFNRCHYDIIVS